MLGLADELARTVQPLLQTHEQVSEEIKQLDAQIAVAVAQDARAMRLTQCRASDPSRR
jgi:hypothetical protein